MSVCYCPADYVGCLVGKAAMKFSALMKGACAMALTAACFGGLVACNGESAKTTAATVGDKVVYEEDVTARIAELRAQYSLEEEASWGEWLAQYEMTPESLRQEIIDEMVDGLVEELAAADQGITVEDSAVTELVEQMKANYDSEEAWQSALKSTGQTEEQYRETLKKQLTQRNLESQVTADAKVSEKDLVETLNMYVSYLDGARKSSHILFAADDEATAKEVLAKLKSGKMKFEDAVAKYSTDTGSAADKGNVGWDKLTSFVTEYTDGLSKLKKGEISDLVKSEFGYHIIKCTDLFNAPKKVKKSSEVPSEIVDFIKEQTAESTKSEAYSKWLEKFKEGLTIETKDMPEGLDYAIDMTPYQKASEDDASADDQAADDEADSKDSKESKDKKSSEKK